MPSSLSLSLTLIISVMIITSPILIFLNPVLISAKGNNNIDTSGQHSAFALEDTSSTPLLSSPSPTNVSPLDSDFTTQAALSSVGARQTNNIVGTQSYYDIVFTTSTTGTIKFIDITFPPGTLIGAPPRLVEREGIGAGNAVQASSTKISYTVTSPVSILEGTKIRLEFFNIVNPTAPSTGNKVTVTTRTAGGTVIDGPTTSNGFSMKQIGTGQIADGAITSTKPAQSFMKRVTLIDDDGGNARGWDPNGVLTRFTILEPQASSFGASFIDIIVTDFTLTDLNNKQCDPVTTIGNNANPGSFDIICASAPNNLAALHYVVQNFPPHVIS